MPIVLLGHREYTEILVEYNFTLCKVNVLWHLSFLGSKMICNVYIVCIESHDCFWPCMLQFVIHRIHRRNEKERRRNEDVDA